MTQIKFAKAFYNYWNFASVPDTSWLHSSHSEQCQLLSFEIRTWTYTKIRGGKILANFHKIKTLPHMSFKNFWIHFDVLMIVNKLFNLIKFIALKKL